MAIDWSNRPTRFSFQTSEVGTILVGVFNRRVAHTIESELDDKTEADPKQIAITILREIAKIDRDKTGKYHEKKLDEEQLNQITDPELEDFASKFMEKNSWVIDSYTNISSVSIEDQESIRLKKPTPAFSKQEEETNLFFMNRSILHYLEKSKKLFEDDGLSFSTIRNLYSDATASLYEENLLISGNLGSQQFLGSQPLQEFSISEPKAKIPETSQLIDDAISQLEKIIILITTMNNLGRRMTANAHLNEARERKYGLGAIGIAIVAIIVSTIFSILIYTSSNDFNKHFDTYFKKLNSHIENNDNLHATTANEIQAHKQSLDSLRKETSNLRDAQGEAKKRLDTIEQADSDSIKKYNDK